MTVGYEVHEQIAHISFDRPAKHNALRDEDIAALVVALRRLDLDDTAQIAILYGQGRSFSSGGDVDERLQRSMDEGTTSGRTNESHAFLECANWKPVIAAVHGYALGGGCELALSCDLIVADESAVFGLPETTVGLVPGGGGTQLALRRLGPGRAADLILTGRKVGVTEAERLGLADRRVPAGTAGEHALALARQIAANSPVAVLAAKRAIRQGSGVSLAVGLEVEDAAWRAAAFSGDRREGIAAFKEKREPQWPGE